jgi:hypothetical protein
MWSFPAVYAPAKSWLAVSVARSRRAWRLAMLDGIMAAGRQHIPNQFPNRAARCDNRRVGAILLSSGRSA